jgi:maleylacetoacetate isomerase
MCPWQYTLFNYFRSSASWRVRIAMQYKGIPYRYHPVNLLKSEQLTDEYVKMNPQRKVPTLVIDGDNKSISQSLAIIDYLEQAHPETPSLFPKDPC